MNAEEFVLQKFRQYYQKNPVQPPREIARREWGFGSWEKKIESRHVGFRNAQELWSYLNRNTPFYISYSTAYYEFPELRPIENKNWLGADLVFDLDAEVEKCEHGRGWVCENCLGKVKSETIRLIEDFLIPDFGFSKKELEVNFSGNRGYHVHVFGEKLRELDSGGRREIADYLAGIGLRFGSVFRSEGKKLTGPTPTNGGWGEKFAKYVLNAVEQDLSILPAKLRKGKKNLFTRGVLEGNWDCVGITKKLEFWQGILESARRALAVPIDQNVTCDIRKLIRLPDSLHGETGFATKRIKNIDGFDPLKHAVVFGNAPVRLQTGKCPSFRIREETFGPFNNQQIVLPEAAAIYLMCKKAADFVKRSEAEK